MSGIVKYIGKSEYCYANSTAMLLSSVGENVSPNLIEVLTGVGLGAFLSGGGLLFFSPLASPPDIGISKALHLLGFDFIERFSKDGEVPSLDLLKKSLKKSPVVIGPLDMSYLVYNPRAKNARGADHYVLVYAIKNDVIYLHDPYGFPYVSLTIDQLKPAWKAEGVGYRRGYYRFWTNPKRVRNPNKERIFNDALDYFKTVYHESKQIASKENRLIDAEAIDLIANKLVKKELDPHVLSHLTYFTFPLGAKRALDYAVFFREFNSNLADLKNTQAKLFGECQVNAAQENFEKLYRCLTELAKIEQQISSYMLTID